MEIDEMINNKRWHKDYRREQVSDYIKKDVAPDMSSLYNQYSPVIDGILSDYKLGAGYGLYQEDGHDFMTFRASDCGQACDTYQSKQEGDFIIIQLDAINKECGSAGYGSAGMSNARYSDKDKKAKKTKIDPCIMFNGEDEVKVTTLEQYNELLDKGYTWLYDCTPSGHGTWADDDVEKSKTEKGREDYFNAKHFYVVGRHANDIKYQYITPEGEFTEQGIYGMMFDDYQSASNMADRLSRDNPTYTFVSISDSGYDALGNIIMRKSKTEKSSLDDILNSDDEFKYQMLGRWKSDLDYYFGAGNRNPSNLWAGDFASHIHNINMVYNSLDVKPDWLNSDMMKEYIRREGYYE